MENLLETNGDHHEALFVHLVRNWYLACNQRGMSTNDRVNNLWAFYAYLCHNVDFDSFPCPGSYMKGIPAVTFYSILQNISIQLHLQCKEHIIFGVWIIFFNFECNRNQSGKSKSDKYTQHDWKLDDYWELQTKYHQVNFWNTLKSFILSW